MSLLEIIDNNIKSAMKSKDSVTLESLRAVKSAILLFKTQSGSSNDMTSEDEIKILQKLVKQRKESADIYKNQNRPELSEVELNQASVIESFLPKQMSRDEVSEVISQIITKLGATTMKEMGKVMGLASKELSGKSDGKTISEIVRKKLSWIGQVVQLDRTSDFDSDGWGFESFLGHYFSLINWSLFIKNLKLKKNDDAVKPNKKPIHTPIALSSVYKPKYTITGNPKIM